MAQVSRRFIKKEYAEKINSLFLNSITKCDSENNTREFLEDLLTNTEKVMLSKRLVIAYLLLQGYTYDVINDILKVSNPTIRTVSLILQYKGRGLKSILNKISRETKWRKFFHDLAESALVILQSGKGGNWSEAKAIERQQRLNKQSIF